MAVDGNSVVKGTEMRGLSYRGRERFLLGIHDTALTSQTRPLTHVITCETTSLNSFCSHAQTKTPPAPPPQIFNKFLMQVLVHLMNSTV